MARRLRLADLPALHIPRPNSKAKPRPRSMTRAARLARAPRQPTAIETFYTSALLELLRRQQRQIRAVLEVPDSSARTDALSDMITVLVSRLRSSLFDLLTEEHLGGMLDKVFDRVNAHSAKETARLIGITLENVPGLGVLIDRFRQENVSLIRSVAEEQLNRVSDVLAKASVEGRRVEDLADHVQEQFGVSESRAALIARDQVLKANANLTQARHVRAGITEYVWTTTGDSRVRDGHRKLDGERFAYGKPPVTDERTSARNAPGEDFQCRCTADPVIDNLL